MKQNESQKQIKQVSKLLSRVLRHQPELLGIELDDQGWTETQTLLLAINENVMPIDKEMLEAVVRENDKQRFSFNTDRSMIRANQGHSLKVELDLPSVEPPVFLYHGTVEKFISNIKDKGLLKMNRQHVHLSLDTATARKVGSRRGKPTILKVAAGQMFADGHVFFLSENKVWLTDHVPPKYLDSDL